MISGVVWIKLIYVTNQLTGFYMMATLAFNELILEAKFGDDPYNFILGYCNGFRDNFQR